MGTEKIIYLAFGIGTILIGLIVFIIFYTTR